MYFQYVKEREARRRKLEVSIGLKISYRYHNQ